MSYLFFILASAKSENIKLASQPRGLAVSEDGKVSVVAGYKHVFVFEGKQLKSTLDFGGDGTSIAISSDLKLVAVGGNVSSVSCYKLITWLF